MEEKKLLDWRRPVYEAFYKTQGGQGRKLAIEALTSLYASNVDVGRRLYPEKNGQEFFGQKGKRYFFGHKRILISIIRLSGENKAVEKVRYFAPFSFMKAVIAAHEEGELSRLLPLKRAGKTSAERFFELSQTEKGAFHLKADNVEKGNRISLGFVLKPDQFYEFRVALKATMKAAEIALERTMHVNGEVEKS
ncbi:MAG: hypothetical protein QMD08_07975 [Actinomycetota bacterium]|nr:hypothetical protein [Actinomycetota bacterium]